MVVFLFAGLHRNKTALAGGDHGRNKWMGGDGGDVEIVSHSGGNQSEGNLNRSMLFGVHGAGGVGGLFLTLLCVFCDTALPPTTVTFTNTTLRKRSAGGDLCIFLTFFIYCYRMCSGRSDFPLPVACCVEARGWVGGSGEEQNKEWCATCTLM